MIYFKKARRKKIMVIFFFFWDREDEFERRAEGFFFFLFEGYCNQWSGRWRVHSRQEESKKRNKIKSSESSDFELENG